MRTIDGTIWLIVLVRLLWLALSGFVVSLFIDFRLYVMLSRNILLKPSIYLKISDRRFRAAMWIESEIERNEEVLSMVEERLALLHTIETRGGKMLRHLIRQDYRREDGGKERMRSA